MAASITAEVLGVLHFNNLTRNIMLARNLGRYNLWPLEFNPAIGEYYDIPDSRPLYRLMGDKSLLEYTQDNESDYSKFINNRYFVKNRGKELYLQQVLTPEQIQPWTETTTDYIQYIDEVFGTDAYYRHVNYINDLLANEFIENGLRQTEVGVLRDIRVSSAIQGAVTTNINNMSGMDTKLGLITNYMYSHTLYNGAIFNSTRQKTGIKDGEVQYNKTYLTPYLVNQYGNNEQNVMELADILALNEREVRIREDLGKDVIINDLDEASNGSLLFMRNMLTDAVNNYKQKYTLESDSKYIVYENKDGETYSNNILIDKSNFNYYDIVRDDSKLSNIPEYGMYSEGDLEGGNTIKIEDDNSQFETYTNIKSTSDSSNSIVVKTNELFNKHVISTMIGRFYSSKNDCQSEFTDTAKSVFGNSHGRNLLKLNAFSNDKGVIINGYENPYCRVWTFHHQYNQVRDLIRPFVKDDGTGNVRLYTLEEIQSMNNKYRSIYKTTYTGKEELKNGGKILAENTVLQPNGFVRITPKKDGGNSLKNTSRKMIEKCMFSIENLAWKDVRRDWRNLSREQRGPNGGRVMWFPPYDLNFQESVNVDWSQNEFIGRGEKVYTYKNTDRVGTLSFTLLIDHPVAINSINNTEYEGKESDKDVQADILRFFAGCDMLGEGRNKKEEKEEEGKKKKEKKDVPDETIKFKVYFPNNFTGLRTNKSGTGYVGGDKYVNFDDYIKTDDGFTTSEEKEVGNYWWRYLFVGNNTIIPTNYNEFRGYEMSDKGGVSNTSIREDEDIVHRFIYTCSKTYPGSVFVDRSNECEMYKDRKGNSDDYRYRYHIDDDLHQLISKSEYSDDNSYKLNSSRNIDDAGIHLAENKEYTFAEFILAIISGETNPSYYNDYYNYAIENGVSEENISKLHEIFTNDQIIYKHITVTGSADSHDRGNAKMLAQRRGKVIENLFKERIPNDKILKDEENFLNVKIEYSDNQFNDKPSYDINNKKLRCCSYEIVYNRGGSEDLSDTEMQNGDSKSESKIEEISFEEYYDVIVSNSDLLKNYDELKSRDFKGWLETFYNSENVNKSKEILTNQEKINEEIKKIVPSNEKTNESSEEKKIDNEANRRDFIELAYSISDYETSKDFIDEVRILLGKSDSGTPSPEAISLLRECEALEKEISELTEQNNGYIKERDEDIAKQEEYGSRIDETEETEAIEASELNKLTRDIKKLQKEIDKLNKKIEENDDKIEELSDKNKETYDKYIQEIINNPSETCPGVPTAINNIKNYKKQISELSKKNTELFIKIINARGKQEYVDAKTKLDQATKDYDSIVENSENSEKTSEVRKYARILRKAKRKYDKEFKKYNDVYIPSKQEITSNNEQIKGLKNQIEFANKVITDCEKRNDISTNDAIIFFDVNGLTIKDSKLTASGSDKVLKYDKFPIRTLNKDNSGNERAKGSDAETLELSYNKMLKHYLFIRRIEQDFPETDYDYVLLFKTAEDDVETCEELLWTIKENTYDCSPACTEENKDKYLKAEEELVAVLDDIANRYERNKTLNDENARKQAEEESKQKIREIEEAKKREEEERKENFKKEMVYGLDDITGIESNRYENEAEFFSTLEYNDPVLFRNLKDKFKYFDPAFHSLSPEGFNARLNFLQQCTRQGGTLEKTSNSDDSNDQYLTASNLAFGRMPVCVIRIGDFIHTKAIIQSMSISYDAASGMIWDLNPEGAGVQPMYAKISLQIVLLGGQSLAAPINKLQNAISFNYYANTEVYDNRADSAVYDAEGIRYRYIWNPEKYDLVENLDEDNFASENDEKVLTEDEAKRKEKFDEEINKSIEENKKLLEDIIQQLRSKVKEGLSYEYGYINELAINDDIFADKLNEYSYVETGYKSKMIVTETSYTINESGSDPKNEDYVNVRLDLTEQGDDATKNYMLVYSDPDSDGNMTIISIKKAKELYDEYKPTLFENLAYTSISNYEDKVCDSEDWKLLEQLMTTKETEFKQSISESSFKVDNELVFVEKDKMDKFVKSAYDEMKDSFISYCSQNKDEIVLVPYTKPGTTVKYVFNTVTFVEDLMKKTNEKCQEYVDKTKENSEGFVIAENLTNSLDEYIDNKPSGNRKLVMEGLIKDEDNSEIYVFEKGIDILCAANMTTYINKYLKKSKKEITSIMLLVDKYIDTENGNVYFFADVESFSYYNDVSKIINNACKKREDKSSDMTDIEIKLRVNDTLRGIVLSNCVQTVNEYSNGINPKEITTWNDKPLDIYRNMLTAYAYSLNKNGGTIKDIVFVTTEFLGDKKYRHNFISFKLLKSLCNDN